MLAIDTEKKDVAEGVWCKYAPGVSLKLRPLSQSDIRQLRKKVTETRLENGREIEFVDPDRVDEETHRTIIYDWKGIVDKKGKPLPCTPENAQLVLGQINALSAWAVGKCFVLAGSQAAARGKQLKNSQGTPDGSDGDPKESEAAAPVD